METCCDRLTAYLTEQHAYFEVQEHRQVYTMQEVAAVLHEKGEHVAKVFIASVDDKPIMLVLPAPGHVDLERVRKLLKATTARRAREFEFAQSVRRLRRRRDAALRQSLSGAGDSRSVVGG